MKIFCECNSVWTYQFNNKFPKVQLNYSQELYKQQFCDKCGYWKWYDSEYEDMMFDLRNMNN